MLHAEMSILTAEVDLICLSRNSHLKGFCDEWPKVKRIIAFDKGERLHSAVAFENFGPFIDTDLAPPKNSSGAKLFRENDVIFIGHVLNLVLRLSLLCLLNEVAMCFVLPRVLVCFLVQFDILFAFGVLSCQILDSVSLFILYVHDHNRLGFGMLTLETATWLHLLI